MAEENKFRITEQEWNELRNDSKEIKEALLGTYDKQGLISKVKANSIICRSLIGAVGTIFTAIVVAIMRGMV